MIRFLSLSVLSLVLAACASNHVLTGTPRPAIDPSQVRVYFAPPPNGYEEIALLESSSGSFTYGEQNKMNSVLGKLRAEAAKLGANGVLFQGTEDGHSGGGVSVGAGGGNYGGNSFTSGGVGVSISPRQKFARGIAVYVANPPPLDAPPSPPPSPSTTPPNK